MSKSEFTRALGKLLVDMHLKGERPFLENLADQSVDIFFETESGSLAEPQLGYRHWHERGEIFGFKPIKDWDKRHFAV